jgi:hypothetical protein
MLIEAWGTHGMTSHPVWNTWNGMRQRCQNPNNKDWKNYGGRGIAVCEPWQKTFEAFFADMGASWFPGAQIDRIDNNKGYEPGNCRWTTAKVQSNNTRVNVWIQTPKGKMTVKQAAEVFGLKYVTLHKRLGKGWTPLRAVTAPVRGAKQRPMT